MYWWETKATIPFTISAFLILIFFTIVFIQNKSLEEPYVIVEEKKSVQSSTIAPSDISQKDIIEDKKTNVADIKESIPSQPEIKEESEVMPPSETNITPSKEIKTPALNEIIVQINYTSFNPKNITIIPKTSVIWVNKDDRIRIVVCYEGVNRIFLSNKLRKDEKTNYIFNKIGNFICKDAIFGLRQNVVVKEGI